MEETIIEKLEKQCNRYILKYLVELAQNDYLALRVEGYTDYDLYIQLPEDRLPRGTNRRNVPINATDVKNITTLIIAKQLQIALEKDENSFYKIPDYYRMINRNAEKESQAYEADIQHYYQTAKKFRKYLDAERKQAGKEQRSSGNYDYLEDEDERNKAYTLPDLYFLRLCVEGKMLLLKLLLARKQPYAITVSGYRLLDEAIQKIKDEGRDIADAKKYVSGCMAIQKLEQANQFIFCARIAEKMIANDIPEDTPFSERFPRTLGRFLLTLPELKDKYIASTRYNTVYTKDDLRLAFDRAEDEPKWLEEKAILSRYIQEKVGAFLTAELGKQGFYEKMWEEKDFRAAREFFKERYKVVESYQPVVTDSDEMMKQKIMYIKFRFREFMEPHTPEGALSKNICYSPLKDVHSDRKDTKR